MDSFEELRLQYKEESEAWGRSSLAQISDMGALAVQAKYQGLTKNTNSFAYSLRLG